MEGKCVHERSTYTGANSAFVTITPQHALQRNSILQPFAAFIIVLLHAACMYESAGGTLPILDSSSTFCARRSTWLWFIVLQKNTRPRTHPPTHLFFPVGNIRIHAETDYKKLMVLS